MFESQSQKVLGLFCAKLHCSAFSSIARWTKHYKPDLTELVLELTLMHVYQNTETFLLRGTVTLTITQMMLLAQTSHSD